MDYIIDKMKDTDWPEVAEIYLQGIETKLATFQPVLPTWDYWDQTHHKDCRFVAKDGEKIVGWVALSPISARKCFSGVAEVSIYIHDEYQGKGIGSVLLRHLVEVSEQEGYWSLQSVIIKENESSLTLHEKCGFRVIGFREKVAEMESSGIWYDCVMMERRSKTVAYH